MNPGDGQGGARPYRMVARAEATAATGRAILRAARDLLTERPYDAVTLAAIAEHAGVTVQTVLRRFGSKEQLIAAAARERSQEIRADREAATPGDVGHLVTHYERFGESQLHLLAQEAHVPEIRALTDAGRKYHAAWVDAAFGPRVRDLPPAVRRRRLAQLAAITDLALWRLLRHDHGLSPAETEAAVRELVERVLPPG